MLYREPIKKVLNFTQEDIMAQQSIKKTDQISRIYDVRKAIFTFLGSAPSICEIMEFFAHIEVYHDIFRVCCNDSETVYFSIVRSPLLFI